MKERITITLDKELLNWLDDNIKSKTFANRSHGFEFLIRRKSNSESNQTKNSENKSQNPKNKENNSTK